jgi:hypothetical protein
VGPGDAKPVGVTSIASAVAYFGISLDRSEEAALHVARVKDLTVEIFAIYRQAFGDSGASNVEIASAAVDGVSGRAELVLGLLERAKKAIRDYAATIAPLDPLEDSGKIRSSSSSEQLVNAPRHRKKLSDAVEITVDNAEDIASAVTDARDVGHSVLELLSPPDPTGLGTVTSTPPEFVPQPVQPVGGEGNIVLTVILGGAILVKGAQIGARKLMKTIFGGKSQTDEGQIRRRKS